MQPPNSANNSEHPVEDFWRVSCRFYESPSVSEYLLELQNKQAKNINELLFALWVSHFYRTALPVEVVERIYSLAERSKSWTGNIRDTRFELEQQWQVPYPEKIKSARNAMLETELKIERLHQQKMVEALVDELATTSLAQYSDDEELLLLNLTRCCGEADAESDYLQLIMLWQQFLHTNQ